MWGGKRGYGPGIRLQVTEGIIDGTVGRGAGRLGVVDCVGYC